MKLANQGIGNPPRRSHIQENNSREEIYYRITCILYKKEHKHGVWLLLSKAVAQCMSVMGYHAMSDRILPVKIHG